MTDATRPRPPAIGDTPNREQIAYWTGPVADRWVRRQAEIDAMMAPITEVLLGALDARAGHTVLDVGCGSGETTLLLARQGVQVAGVDVSPQLLDLARARAREAGLGPRVFPAFLDADASQLPPVRPVGFDAIVSRFGVMFFAQPEAAFASLARQLRPGGRCVFACWRAPQENGWVQVPMQALAGLVRPGAAADHDAPGPFAFARAERIAHILRSAGLMLERLTPVDVSMVMGAEAGAQAGAAFMAEIGPAARALADLAPEDRATARTRLESVVATHLDQGRLKLGGAVWIVEARRP